MSASAIRFPTPRDLALIDVLGKQRFDVEDRRAVERFEMPYLNAMAVDRGDLDAVQADGIRAMWGAGAEDAFLRAGAVAARVDAEDCAIGAVEPGEQQDLVSYMKRGEGVED